MQQKASGPVAAGGLSSDNSSMPPRPRIIHSIIDLRVLKGGGRGPTKLGVVPLSDGAGEVAAVGERVTRVKVGDRIIGTFHPRWFGGPISADYLTDRLGANLDGMLAEYSVLDEEALVHMPGHLSFEEAATLPCAAVTAQFARVLGARVIATTSSTEKADRLKALGARRP
jgi:NADPH:quinone reductase-like Zn-dependent oxidoreductase